MKDPSYRIATLCPHGMSEPLQRYLQSPANSAEPTSLRNRDAIALRMLDHYRDADLPFGCTLLAWAQSTVPLDLLSHVTLRLGELSTATGTEKVSSESFGNKVAEGHIHLGGLYPLLDLAEPQRSIGYQTISLLANNTARESLFSWAYNHFLRGCLQTDELGFVMAVLSDSDDLAESKAREAVELVQQALNSFGA